MTENSLENKIQKENETPNPRKLDLSRIAWTTIGYGIVGSFFYHPEIVAPACAAIGCGAAIYDEKKGGEGNLVKPVITAFVGGIIGSFFNSPELNQYIPQLTTYAGMAIGAGLGLYNYQKK